LVAVALATTRRGALATGEALTPATEPFCRKITCSAEIQKLIANPHYIIL
jgi:hypothetical protein